MLVIKESIMKTFTEKDLLTFYQSAFNGIASFAYLLDNEGHLIACNQNLLNVLSLEEFSSKAVGAIYTQMLESHFGNQRQLAMHKKADIAALVSEEQVNSDKPVEFWLNQEKTHLFNVIRTPIYNSSKKTLGLLVEMIDVTETVYLNEQLDKIRKELVQRNKKAAEMLAYSPTSSSRKGEKQIIDMASPLVLVIEDDENAQKAVKSVLMHCNFDVHLAHDEEEFENKFAPGKYQLVFMDISLEETSGYMIAKSLREMERDTKFHVPIIALTGYDPKNLSGDCDYYSMEGAIQKPLTIEQASQINQRYISHIDIDITGFEPAKPIM